MAQLLVFTENHNTSPVQLVDYVISLYTDLWVLAHPANLLAECSKSVDVPFVRDKINRDHVGLLIANAAETSELDLFQEVETLVLGQLLNDHWKSAFRADDFNG